MANYMLLVYAYIAVGAAVAIYCRGLIKTKEFKDIWQVNGITSKGAQATIYLLICIFFWPVIVREEE